MKHPLDVPHGTTVDTCRRNDPDCCDGSRLLGESLRPSPRALCPNWRVRCHKLGRTPGLSGLELGFRDTAAHPIHGGNHYARRTRIEIHPATSRLTPGSPAAGIRGVCRRVAGYLHRRHLKYCNQYSSVLTNRCSSKICGNRPLAPLLRTRPGSRRVLVAPEAERIMAFRKKLDRQVRQAPWRLLAHDGGHLKVCSLVRPAEMSRN
jgi:hypothetical protein